MTTTGCPDGSQPESLHTVSSSSLSLPPPSSPPHPSNPPTLARPQPGPEPQPGVPLVVQSSPLSLPPPPSPPSRPISPISPHPSPGPCSRQPSVKTIPKECNASNTASFTTNKKPTHIEVASLYQFIYDRIDDLKILTGALCERIIALEDTVATLSEKDTMETFMKKACDMAMEGHLIGILGEKFAETGTKIVERGADVGVDDFLETGIDRRPGRQDPKPGNGEGGGDGDEEGRDGNNNEKEGNNDDNDNDNDNEIRDDGKAKEQHGWDNQGAVVIDLVNAGSDLDL